MDEVALRAAIAAILKEANTIPCATDDDAEEVGDTFELEWAENELVALFQRFRGGAERQGDVSPVKQFIALADACQELLCREIPWETKYDLVFSDTISGRIRELGIKVDWCDPDAGYQDDVCAYVSAVAEKADELRKVADLL